MTEDDSLCVLVNQLEKTAPELIELLTATTDDEFDDAFDGFLQKAVTHLECNKTHFKSLDEEGLTAVVVASLQKPGLSVKQEPHSNGHVDIEIETIYGRPQRRKLGEAKIYNGPRYHFEGVEQLLSRYTTGRECRGLLLVYVRKRNVKQLITQLRQTMYSERPCKQLDVTTDSVLKWSFLSKHEHSSGEDVQVSHVACNLFCDV